VPAAPPAKPGSQLQAPPPSTRIRPKDGPGTPATEEKALITPRAAPAQDRPARPPQAAPAATRSAEDALSRLDESKLRVMAIAWSGDPLKRLAVVNGHIVKEGESVEGYNINQIRKDDVIVNDGARSWRVELNLKTQP
jgi:Type II secretion system protein B